MSKAKRMEAKKRKIQAFLEVAELNDNEGRKRASLAKEPRIEEEPVKKEKLEGDALEELRKRLKARKALLKNTPHFQLKSKGHDASLEIPVDLRTPLLMRDLQQLLLYALLGSQAPIEPMSWAKIDQWKKLSQINVMVVDGLGSEDVTEDKMASIRHFFPTKLEFIPPIAYNSCLADDLSILPLSKRLQIEFSRKYGHISKAFKSGEAFKVFRSLFKVNIPAAAASENPQPSEEEKHADAQAANPEPNESREESNDKLNLLLNVNQMIEEHYPLPLEGPMKQKYVNYVSSHVEYNEVSKNSPIFSIDCEMCLTTANKHELTKICVIDSDLKPIYESFVKPDNPIVNYLTQYSGITPKMLQDVKTKLSDVQKALQELLPKDAIWVGHSLGNDLKALEMFHPYVIDTSLIYNISGDRRRKAKLKLLSHMFLGQEIQCAADKGHDPKEDAEAAMKLVLLKLEKGLNFGDAIIDNVYNQELLESNKESKNPEDKNVVPIASTSIFSEVEKLEKTLCVIAEKNILDGYRQYWKKDEGDSSILLLESSTSKDTIKKTCDHSLRHNMTICHVDCKSLDDDKKWTKVKKWTKKVKDVTALNGLFVTIWTGTENQKAFVGIALNKEETD